MASTGFIVDMDNFGNGGRQLRLRCSHTRLFCTLFWLPWFRASRQPKNLEADRVQPVSTVSKPPTGTAEERHNGTYRRLNTVGSIPSPCFANPHSTGQMESADRQAVASMTNLTAGTWRHGCLSSSIQTSPVWSSLWT